MVVIQRREYGKNGVLYTQYRLNIPQKIIESLRWDANDEIEFILDDSNYDVKLVCKNLSKKQ